MFDFLKILHIFALIINNSVMKKQNLQINTKTIEERFIVLRGQEVLIDRGVAELYGVETKRVNEAVKNNPEKFPEG